MFLYTQNSCILVVLVYVDDIIITGSNSLLISQFIRSLNQNFALKDLGPLHSILGVEALCTSFGLFLTQTKYINDLLSYFDMKDSKLMPTPMSCTQLFSQHNGTKLVDPTMYRSAVGALQYSTLTCPDINYVVNKMCQYMHSPFNVHWQAVK